VTQLLNVFAEVEMLWIYWLTLGASSLLLPGANSTRLALTLICIIAAFFDIYFSIEGMGSYQLKLIPLILFGAMASRMLASGFRLHYVSLISVALVINVEWMLIKCIPFALLFLTTGVLLGEILFGGLKNNRIKRCFSLVESGIDKAHPYDMVTLLALPLIFVLQRIDPLGLFK
jgi:hypothetical protein